MTVRYYVMMVSSITEMDKRNLITRRKKSREENGYK